MKKVLLLLVMSFGFCGMTYAQFTVKGNVTSSTDGIGLFGVTVFLKGTTNGVTTDVDGNYTLNIPSGNQTLVFSYVGFTSQEIEVQGRSTIDIILQEELTSLGEVVVIGYGTQKKKLVTGATVNVDGEKLEALSNTNALQSLQGQTAGVNITSTSGQPGAGFDVVIRGVGTNGNSSPLYVVDGLPVGDITYLNNADIESIDVLKDAASAAIYGSRAANGIVLITTKKGSAGKPQLSFDSYYGVQQIANQVDMLNAREYATIMNEQAINSGKLPYYSNAEIAALGEGTDWFGNILVDDAVTQNYSVGLQGGNNGSIYSTSFSYTGQEGIVGGRDYSNYERYVARVNSEHKLIDDIITIGENLTYSYVKQVGIADGGQYSNQLRGAFNTHPLMPVYDDQGNFYNNAQGEFIDQGTQSNPFGNLAYNNNSEGGNQRLVGNVYLAVEPIEGLKFRTSFGVESSTGQGRSYRPVYELSIYDFNDTSSVSQNANENLNWNWENTVSYQKDFAGGHHAEVLVGSSAQKWRGSWLSASNANLAFDDLKYAYLGNTTYANGPRMGVDGEGYESSLASYFARLLYDFDEKYMFTATMRADGTSNFAEGNRWGYFPSVSAGWVMSSEEFFQSRIVSFMKLRASWGQNGNNFVPAFRFLAPIAVTNANYSFGQGEGQLVPGAVPNRISNPDLQWETSEQLDIGLDIELLEGKIFANIDWYKKTTKDWLIQAPILATAGAEAPYINGGNVTNTGIELVLGWKESIGDLDYSLSFNGAYNKNEVNDIPAEGGIIHGSSNELWNNAPEFYRAQEGFPVGYFWGYETLGVFQNEAEVSAYRMGSEPIQPNALPGDLIIKDVNGDGRITDDDKTMIGDPNPDFVFGFNITANYKGFDLLVNANGVIGNQLVQSYRSVTDQYSNYTREILNRWHGEGTSNEMPRVYENGRNYANFSDIYVKDGDFLRINNITVGYDLSNVIKKDAFKKVRVFLTGQNLFTFTKYSGMDPEIGYGQTFARGVDVGYYPRPRVFMAGVNLKF